MRGAILKLSQTSARLRTPLLEPANLISASRLLFAGLWIEVFPLRERMPGLLISIALTAAISDLVDGPVARHRGAVNKFGYWFDNACDAFFLLAALMCEARTGALPFYVPLLVFACFTQYAIDSVLLLGSAVPVRSRVGHWGGIVNFGLVLILACATYAPYLALFTRQSSPALGFFYAAGIFERLLAYPCFKPVCERPSDHSIPGWRAAEREPR
jgi:phosphatidylglycerophosphate synthase